MNNFETSTQDYWFGLPTSPLMQPVLGEGKLWELENDYSYLKYLYPDICSQINEFITDECDQLEYDGSPIFDSYPDKITLQRLAQKILRQCNKKDPDTYPMNNTHLRDLVEILLYHEILFRRNRYRNRKRLYF